MVGKLLRPSEAVPARHPLVRNMPHRHDEVMPQEHSVERLGRRQELFARFGVDQPFDEMVDRCILNARIVAAAFALGGFGAPILPLFVPGRQRLRPACPDHVELEVLHAPGHLGTVEGSHPRLDSKLLELLGVRNDDAFQGWIVQQKFRRQDLALRIFKHRGAALLLLAPACFLQELRPLPEIVAPLRAVAAHRIFELGREHLRRHLVLYLVQELKFQFRWQARCGQLRIGEEARGSCIFAVEQVGVRPFEIESIVERQPHARILEFRLAQIEHETLHRLGVLGRQFFLDDFAAFHGWEIVSGRPDLGCVLQPEVVAVGLESFERDACVEKVLVTDLVEIILPDVHRQVLAPIILDPLEPDECPGLHLYALVDPRSEWNLERARLDVALPSVLSGSGPPVLWQNRQLAHDLRQLAVSFLRKYERHFVFARLFDLAHVLVVSDVERMGPFQRVHRPDHVRGGDLLAVVKASFRPQAVTRLRVVFRIPRRVGDQPVFGGWLVERGGEQGLVVGGDPGGLAAVSIGIEAVERADRVKPELSALRRVWIDVIEVREVRRIFKLAEQRQPVPPGFLLRLRHRRADDLEACDPAQARGEA